MTARAVYLNFLLWWRNPDPKPRIFGGLPTRGWGKQLFYFPVFSVIFRLFLLTDGRRGKAFCWADSIRAPFYANFPVESSIIADVLQAKSMQAGKATRH